MYHTMKARYLLVLFALLVALPQAMNAKKKKEVSIQLYSVRDVINKGTDLNVVLKDLAEMDIPVLKQPIMTTESSMVKLPKNSRVQ